MATVSINSEQITSIANSLKSKSSEIVNKYKGDCTSAIQMSAECIKISGLDIEQFFKALENIYTKVSDRVGSLADFLVNNVATEYESVSSAISSNFTNEFAQALSGLIPGVGVASGATSGGSSSSSGSTGQTDTSNNTEGEVKEVNVKTEPPLLGEDTVNATPQTSAPVVEDTPVADTMPLPQTSAPVATTPVTAAPVANTMPLPQTSAPVYQVQQQVATVPAIAGSVIMPTTAAPIATPNIPNLSGMGNTAKPNVSGLTSGILDFLNSNS